MPDFDLLSTVQPDEGYFAVVGIKDGEAVRQKLVDNRRRADILIRRLSDEGFNAYFGVAKFKTDENRKKENVLSLKAFWLDLDCGVDKFTTGKGYRTKGLAVTALERFCEATELPLPIIVDSGRGIHAYWALTEPVSRETWEQTAASLRWLCEAHELRVDRSVFEVARILRVPGTKNYKDDPPELVKVLHPAKPMEFTQFQRCVTPEGETATIKGEPPRRELSPLQQTLGETSFPPTSFTKILERGCEQLLDCVAKRETLEEPRWRSALSIAQVCTDRTEAIVHVSSGHPGYTFTGASAKAEGTVGPHSCLEFEKNNPGGCDSCPHKGQITSPVVLGRYVERDEMLKYEAVDERGEIIQHVVPELGWPYFRPKNGGVGINVKDGDPINIYPYDLYAVRRMRDPVLGDVVVMRVHLPQDGMKEFILANAQVVEAKDLRKALAIEGVICPARLFDLLAAYLIWYISNLQKETKADLMRTQFGWTDRDSAFILGNQEIRADGMFHSPPSTITAPIAVHMGPKGDMEKWKEVFNLYGRPGLEPHAFAALTAFGAPILRFSGQKGVIINVVSPQSGTGKTTILHMCNSVYGSPDKLCARKEDTENAKIARMGILNNLPVTFDEMTNVSASALSTFAYAGTQGQGKDRMMGSTNQLRVNDTSWQTMVLCSSNSSFYEKLAAHKLSPDGESMRLIEYKIAQSDIIAAQEAKNAFDNILLQNYGHAGPAYIRYLVQNFEQVQMEYNQVQVWLDQTYNLTSRERFWSAGVAANLTGGLVAAKLDLMDWDMPRITRWVTAKLMVDLREQQPVDDIVGLRALSDYIYAHTEHMLVIDSTIKRHTVTSMQTVPTIHHNPTRELLIRYEPDTEMMYLLSTPFRKYCAENQINYRETVKWMKDNGIYIKSDVFRMSTGYKGINIPGQALYLSMKGINLVDAKAIAELAAANEH